MLIIIDTNIWISALVFGGNPRRVVEIAAKNGFLIGFSLELLAETKKILQAKFPDFLADFDNLIAALRNHIKLIVTTEDALDVSRDPKDNFLIKMAKNSAADYLVSGDKDLTTIVHYGVTKIVTPAEFMALVDEING